MRETNNEIGNMMRQTQPCSYWCSTTIGTIVRITMLARSCPCCCVSVVALLPLRAFQTHRSMHLTSPRHHACKHECLTCDRPSSNRLLAQQMHHHHAHLAVLVLSGHHGAELLLVAGTSPVRLKHAIPAARAVPKSPGVRLPQAGPPDGALLHRPRHLHLLLLQQLLPVSNPCVFQ